MPAMHEPWLVALSIAVAIQGAYVGLSLAVQMGAAAGVRRRLLLAGAALSLGVAIWSMHFVGMLAVRLPFPVDYLVLPTLLSFLVCVIVVGAAVFAASAGPLTPPRLGASAVFMGLGIVSMHYIGMWALHASAHMTHAIPFVIASVAIAIAASGLALFLASGRAGRVPLIGSAAALGIAISGMHYTAMAGVTIWPHEALVTTAPVLSTDLLAIVVAVVAFGVSGIFLLILVPERLEARSEALADRRSPISEEAAPRAPAPAAHPDEEGAATAAAGHPLAAAVHDAPSDNGDGAVPTRVLPVQRDGATSFIAVREIAAVHANAHYTYVFDGRVKLFCPLSIGEVQARLDAEHFVQGASQPHRQYRACGRPEAQRGPGPDRARRRPRPLHRAGKPQPLWPPEDAARTEAARQHGAQRFHPPRSHHLRRFAALQWAQRGVHGWGAKLRPNGAAPDPNVATSLTHFVQHRLQFVQPPPGW